MAVKVLLTNDDAIASLPTVAETTLFASMIHQKYPLIKNDWGATDGSGWSESHLSAMS
jgi:hypothetical protein